MKLWKHTLISALAFFSVCTMVVYSACDRDSCLTLKCSHNAPCVNGFCQCPTGYEGTQCEKRVLDRYVGTYIGNTQCNGAPPVIDTLWVTPITNPNVIDFRRYRDYEHVYHGVIDGDNVIVTDSMNSTVKVTVNVNKITVNIENTANGQSSSCTFVGTRP
jgi:hypothetical protein